MEVIFLDKKILILPILGIFITAIFIYFYMPTPPIPPTGEVKKFSITAKRWEFNQTTIEVNAGDSVIITLIGLDDGSGGGHGFEISAFGVNLEVTSGTNVTHEFLANKRGTFTFRCSVPCGTGHASMGGNLVVI
jgi:cytochrome c oxidase subunit 2